MHKEHRRIKFRFRISTFFDFEEVGTGGKYLKSKPDHILDFSGTISPFMRLKVRQVFREMAPMQTMEIVCSDPMLEEDLKKVLPEAYCVFETLETDNDGNFRFRIEKKSNNQP